MFQIHLHMMPPCVILVDDWRRMSQARDLIMLPQDVRPRRHHHSRLNVAYTTVIYVSRTTVPACLDRENIAAFQWRSEELKNVYICHHTWFRCWWRPAAPAASGPESVRPPGPQGTAGQQSWTWCPGPPPGPRPPCRRSRRPEPRWPARWPAARAPTPARSESEPGGGPAEDPDQGASCREKICATATR